MKPPEGASGWGTERWPWAERLRLRLRDTWLNPLHLARRNLRRALLRAAPHARGRLLDVGCGRQRYRRLFQQIEMYVGVDLPSNSAGSRTFDAFADGMRLPFAGARFDTVLCTEVLEHVSEPKWLMGEVARALRPGGKLILTTPQTWGLHEAPHDYFRFTEFGLRYLAESAGLRVIEVIPTCGVWATVGQRTASFLFFDLGRGLPVSVKAVLAVCLVPWQLAAAGMDALFGHRGDPLDHLLIAVKT